MKKKKLKPRYKFLIASLLILSAGFLSYALITGGNYQIGVVYGIDYIDKDIEFTEQPRAVSSDENIVKVNSIYTVTDYSGIKIICVETQSVNQGKCSVDVSYRLQTNTQTVNLTYDLEVLPTGFIYDLTTDSFSAMKIGIHVEMLLFILITVVLVMSFIEKFKNADFSYSMAVLGGVILFIALSILTTLSEPWFWQVHRSIISVPLLLSHILNSGFRFISITTIPVILLAAALCVSNIILFKKEGFKPHNALGFFIGIAILAGFIVVELSGNYENINSEFAFAAQTIFNYSSVFLLCYFECMLISTAFCAVTATKYKVKYDIDYIIILGCALMGDGTPTPHLMGRIQRAYDFETGQYGSTGKHAKYVPSGGQGSDEVVSEAESMRRKLVELGIDEGMIIKEDKSVNTLQNMLFSKGVIEKDCGNIDGVNIAFATTNYHVFRGYTLAKKVGMKVKGLSAKTKLYFFPNAFIREFIGLIWEQKLRHLLFALLIVASLTTLYLFIFY